MAEARSHLDAVGDGELDPPVAHWTRGLQLHRADVTNRYAFLTVASTARARKPFRVIVT
jgi:hypothetical protein